MAHVNLHACKLATLALGLAFILVFWLPMVGPPSVAAHLMPTPTTTPATIRAMNGRGTFMRASIKTPGMRTMEPFMCKSITAEQLFPL